MFAATSATGTSAGSGAMVGEAARAAALLVGDRVIDGPELADLVRARAAGLPDPLDGRCLVHVRFERTLDAVISYLAVLEAGHVALLLSPTGADEVVATYPGDFSTERGGFVATGYRGRPTHLLHPDLAVLMSTSGSTGSPKLVRLSKDNLRANAEGIVAALGLTARDRGITALPFFYCYGLSVLHAHLLAGASLVLHDGSSVSDDFWDVVAQRGVTNVPLVPHSAGWLLDNEVLDRDLPALRLLTQAGGRLTPDSVRELALAARRRGCRLQVMYGQTESTARIAVASPQDTLQSPDGVGRPINGTTARIDTTVPEANSPGVGELVVAGRSIMLGYAEHPDDLALGRMISELRTGDLATIDADGMVRIVGRRRNFVKIMGLRVDLGRVEAALGEAGFEAVVTGDDDGLRVLVAPGRNRDVTTASKARRAAARAAGVGPAVVEVAVAPLPMLANGKVDRLGADALVRAAVADACTDTRGRMDGVGADVTVPQVAAVLGDLLAVDSLDPDRSFVEQGGDSLTHVPASARLTRLVGDLPRDWHHRPIRELVAAASPRRPGVEAATLLRAVAVLLICFSHTRVIDAAGGAHILLAIAGWNAARFGFSLPTRERRLRATARSIIGIWMPTAAAALAGMILTARYGWQNVFLVNWVFGGLEDTRVELWFVDSLVACLLVTTALLAIPRFSRLRDVDPYRFFLPLAAIALVPRFVAHAISDIPVGGVPYTVFWIFAAGAALGCARTTARRLGALAVVGVGVATYFPDPQRNLTIFLGVVVLAVVREVRLPARIVPLVVLLASASLYIYVFQFQLFQIVPRWEPGPVPGALRSLTALVGGCLLWRLADPAVARLRNLLPVEPHRKD
ncbi:AMP-binding protein [Calidifontibacter indicus]|uniref:AMP-binding protein n=1 Tax=Calidifontibacter indicus TaxID=419650 RepID=UPI003D705CF5